MEDTLAPLTGGAPPFVGARNFVGLKGPRSAQLSDARRVRRPSFFGETMTKIAY